MAELGMATPKSKLAKAIFGRGLINDFIGSLQFAGLRTLSGMVSDYTTDSGRVSFASEAACDPSLINARFRDGNNQENKSFFSAKYEARHGGHMPERFSSKPVSGSRASPPYWSASCPPDRAHRHRTKW